MNEMDVRVNADVVKDNVRYSKHPLPRVDSIGYPGLFLIQETKKPPGKIFLKALFLSVYPF
jgi:hypothetical protein